VPAEPSRMSLTATYTGPDGAGLVTFRLAAELTPDCSPETAAQAAQLLCAAWDAVTVECDPDMIQAFRRTLAHRLDTAQRQPPGERGFSLRFPLELSDSQPTGDS